MPCTLHQYFEGFLVQGAQVGSVLDLKDKIISVHKTQNIELC